MSAPSYKIYNTSGVEINCLDFPVSGTVTIRVQNLGTTTGSECLVGAAMALFSYAGAKNIQGQECITEQWLEAREGLGAWTPIGGDPTNAANTLSVTPAAGGAYTAVELRLNVPSGATTGGNFSFIPFVMWAI